VNEADDIVGWAWGPPHWRRWLDEVAAGQCHFRCRRVPEFSGDDDERRWPSAGQYEERPRPGGRDRTRRGCCCCETGALRRNWQSRCPDGRLT